jgi:hypothetical protein
MRLAAAKYIDLALLRNVFVVSLLAGVGITVLFAVGVRSLVRAEAGEAPGANRTLAAACVLAVLVGVAVGLWAVLAK